MNVRETLETNREEIRRIAAKHGVERIRVFGSVVRGDATESSDLDFLIVSGEKRTPWFPGGLVADLEDLLGRRVDVVEERALHEQIREHVLAEAQPV